MQYSSTDGTETKIIRFANKQVARYKELFDLTDYEDNEVPPLYCAKLWGSFELFQQFKRKAITLVKTNMQQLNNLKVEEDYNARLTLLSSKKLKMYRRYEFLIEINKNNFNCISIKQSFIERLENDSNN